jgi:hypothetical protein
MIASLYVVEEARRYMDKANHRIDLEKCLSQVKLISEADPGISCPIPLPEKDCPVLMAALITRADCLATGDLIHFGPPGRFSQSAGGKRGRKKIIEMSSLLGPVFQMQVNNSFKFFGVVSHQCHVS